MPVLRNANPALVAALAAGVMLYSADLFEFDLVDGVTKYYWTSWPFNLPIGGNNYSSQNPWLNRSKWNVTNTMQVPQLVVKLMALNTSFAGGANIKTQIHAGLFAGSTMLLSRVYMTPTEAKSGVNIGSTYGTVDLFGGFTGAIDLTGTTASITCKGKNNRLNQYGPRATYQIPCNHAFCDIGCTLNRATFTHSLVVGSGATPVYVPWTVAPANPTNLIGGTMTITSGGGDAQQRLIVDTDSGGAYLVYPLFEVPAPGDTWTGFEGCDKTFDSGSGRSCTDRNNMPNYDGFEFVPAPTAVY